MELTMLGTGHAVVTECYNTCFVITDSEKRFMVDGGGGCVLAPLKRANINWLDIHDIFVTHKHIDHLTGIIWILRVTLQMMNHNRYDGELNIYSHNEVIDLLHKAADQLFEPAETRFIDDRLHLITVDDGESRTICDHEITFFDTQATKTKEYGFSMELSDKGRLVCCGDEPCRESAYPYAQDCEWLLHEAFCMAAQEDKFHPHEKSHSTVADACETAQKLHVRNLVLYHTEDSNMAQRKMLYTQEGQKHYSGNLFVPDDLETIQLTR